MDLFIMPENEDIRSLYEGHTHYHEGDSGLDLFCPENLTILAGQTASINFMIKCEAKNQFDNYISYYLYPRSSISMTPLRMSNSIGIIDAGYRGNIIAKVDNIQGEDYVIERGTRLFQICSPTLSPIKINIVNALSETTRGEDGFGSTQQAIDVD